MHILSNEEEPGVATMTISVADDDHKFEVWAEGGNALVKYQETLSWRSQIRVSEPDEDIYKALMVSDEMMKLLDTWNVNGVKRAEPTP